MKAWREVPGVEFVGICNRTVARADQLAQEFGVPHTGSDLGALLADLKPDFVDICTAVETHLGHVETAAKAGVPILCQKPLAPTLEESVALVETAEKYRVRLMVNDNWRFQSWYREIKRILKAGTLGSLFSAHLAMRPADGWGPEPYARQPYFREMPQFLILETGIHYIDTLRYLFGEIASLYCTIRRRNPVIAGEDQALLVLNFQDGMLGVWDANRAAPFPAERPPFNGFMRIEGSEGTLEVEADGSIFMRKRGGERLPHAYHIEPGYRGGSAVLTQRHFIECLRSGEEFEITGRDYLNTVRAVFAAYDSAASGQPVHLST